MRQEQKASTYRFLSARNASLGLFVWGMVFILLALSILIPVPYQCCLLYTSILMQKALPCRIIGCTTRITYEWKLHSISIPKRS